MGLRKPHSTPQTATKAVLYARVSSREQREEGYSIEAQMRLLREYAAKQRFVVAEEFIDVESASRSGRTGFNAMLAYLRKQPSCRAILVEKTDRLYRNLKDYVTLDVKVVKEGDVLRPDSKSSQQLMHEIKVVLAHNYSQNLGEETIKGMTEKARAGMYPSCAPIGYKNADGPAGKRVIVLDPDTAPTINRLFELFASGNLSLKQLAARASEEGLTLRGVRIRKSALQQILRKRIYSGDFDFSGETYQGNYEPLVSKETWERVQSILNNSRKTNRHRIRHDFAFSGLVRCGHCGCMLVAEVKKGRYVYYHCTGYRGKCLEPYTREERLIEQFACNLEELVIPPEVTEWLQATYLQSDLTERAARDRTIKQHQAQFERLEARIETLYMDRLDGRINPAFYDAKAGEFRAQQQAILRKIEQIRSSSTPVEDALNLMQLTSQAATLFRQQNGHEQRRLLRTLVKNAAWQGGELRLEFEEPFEILRGSNRANHTKEMQITGSGRDSEIWLPDQFRTFDPLVNSARVWRR
jgi:DNA invertase Pin-like site-specific DNA recombinase